LYLLLEIIVPTVIDLNYYLLTSLKQVPNPNENIRLQGFYRATFLMHAWAMDAFRFLVPGIVLSAEFTAVIAFFITVRTANPNEVYICALALAVGIIDFLALKAAVVLASKVAEVSKDYIGFMLFKNGGKVSTLDRRVWISCRPLLQKVGSTFTITKETFPTMSQDIILGNVITLLLMFR